MHGNSRGTGASERSLGGAGDGRGAATEIHSLGGYIEDQATEAKRQTERRSSEGVAQNRAAAHASAWDGFLTAGPTLRGLTVPHPVSLDLARPTGLTSHHPGPRSSFERGMHDRGTHVLPVAGLPQAAGGGPNLVVGSVGSVSMHAKAGGGGEPGGAAECTCLPAITWVKV